MIKEFKKCSKCNENKPVREFYKHRGSCKQCKIKYQLNRYHDLKDGKRDMVNWYNENEEMTNEGIIEHLNKVIQENKNTNDYNDSKETRFVCYFFFLLPVLIITFVILKALGLI